MTPDNTNVLTLPKAESAPKPALADNIVPKKIRILGVPLDLGQTRRGVDMGPSAVRVAGLEARLEALGHIVEDGGNIAVAQFFNSCLSSLRNRQSLARAMRVCGVDLTSPASCSRNA